MRAALFLDRDGVINVDHGYVHRIDQVQWVDGIFELGRAARGRGLALVIVTNQSGIARGYYGEAEFHALMAWMSDQFDRAGAPIAGVYHCPYHPTEGIGAWRRDSDERKPGPGMLLRAARELALDLRSSWLIGDRDSDIDAGRAAGLWRLVRLVGQGEPPPAATPGVDIVSSLHEARQLVEAALPAASASPAHSDGNAGSPQRPGGLGRSRPASEV